MFKRSPNFPLEKTTKIWMVNQLLIGLCLTLLARSKSYERSRHSLKSAVQQSICNRHFEEVIALAKLKSKELGRIIGIYPKQNTLLFMRRKIYT
jgi:hypothetical protein